MDREIPSEFNLAVTKALDDLAEFFDNHSKHILVHAEKPALFKEVVKATIIKAYQFAVSLDKHNTDYMFFSLPALRGICEDYIVEKFIFEKLNDKKEEIIYLKYRHDHLKSSIIQWKYFEKYRRSQFLFYKMEFPEDLKEVERTLKDLIKSLLPKVRLKPVFPSVFYMSEQTGLLELYNYLYHATSTFVHFTPTNLLRMGWGDLPNITFSAANFKAYYKDFSMFYSILLLTRLCEWQQENGFLEGFDLMHIHTLNDILQRAERWPEIVTFEEMNIGAMSKHLFYTSPELFDNKKGL